MTQKNGRTIWVTDQEYALIAESKDLFYRFTKAKMSMGAYLCALSLGGLAAKSLNGILMRCANCGNEVEMTMHLPKKPARMNHSHRRPQTRSPASSR